MRNIRSFALLLLAASLFALTACGGAISALPLEGDAEGYSFVAFRHGAPIDLALHFEEHVQTRAATFDLLLTGHDGFTARVSGDDLTGCALVYSREHAWEFRSQLHPPPANVKNLASIAVVSVSEDPRALRLVGGDNETRSITAGQLRMLSQRHIWREEGTSQANSRHATVYTARRGVPLADIMPEGEAFAATAFHGETAFLRGADESYLLSEGNQVGLLLPDGRVLHDLAGLMANPPNLMITEAFNDATHALAQGERVIVINLDGLGWDMLQYAPYLGALNPSRALACYPPVSAVGLAAILTGVTPDVNGIQGRGQREPACEDLFAAAQRMGKTSANIGSGSSVIKTSLRAELALNDADAFMLAMQALEARPDLLFVHLHGIDEAAHTYGPHAEETQRAIGEIDGYARALAERFDGRAIITADHGLHATDDGGNHGLFLPEDMIVPYIFR